MKRQKRKKILWTTDRQNNLPSIPCQKPALPSIRPRNRAYLYKHNPVLTLLKAQKRYLLCFLMRYLRSWTRIRMGHLLLLNKNRHRCPWTTVCSRKLCPLQCISRIKWQLRDPLLEVNRRCRLRSHAYPRCSTSLKTRKTVMLTSMARGRQNNKSMDKFPIFKLTLTLTKRRKRLMSGLSNETRLF